jgi:hypothetical protein
MADWPEWAERALWKATEWPVVRAAAEWALNGIGAVPYHGDRFTSAKYRKEPMSDEPLSKAMADRPSADTIAANEIMRRFLARPDPPPETEEETRARRAADTADLREWKSYSSDSHETDGFDKIRDENRSEPVDTKTAKAEIAHGKQDMRAAKLEQADAFWQQTINAGRLAQQAEPQKQPEKDKVAEPQQ